MIETAKFLNEIGLWEVLNLLLVLSGFIYGAIYLFRRNRIPHLNLHVAHHRRVGQNYTSLVDIEFRNYTGCSVVISSPYFRYNKLKADKAAHRDSYSGDTEVKFLSKNGETGLTEVETFLMHKENTSTWIPIDPNYSDDLVSKTLQEKKVGTLYFNCTFIKEKPATYKMAVKI